MQLKVKRLDKDMPMPQYAKEGDAGFDLRSTESITVMPGCTEIVGTGLAFEIPDGFFGLIAPRSGLGSRYGLTLANTPSIIDSGYRGEVKLALHKLAPMDDDSPLGVGYLVERGERVAQMVIIPYASCEFEDVDELSETDRGSGGFGSSGR